HPRATGLCGDGTARRRHTMRRLLPHPLLAASLLIFWLIIQQSAGLGHIVLGGIIAVSVSLMAQAVLVDKVKPRRPLKIIQLIFVAGLDIIRSNLAVMSV